MALGLHLHSHSSSLSREGQALQGSLPGKGPFNRGPGRLDSWRGWELKKNKHQAGEPYPPSCLPPTGSLGPGLMAGSITFMFCSSTPSHFAGEPQERFWRGPVGSGAPAPRPQGSRWTGTPVDEPELPLLSLRINSTPSHPCLTHQ